jgi:hypothetical protein
VQNEIDKVVADVADANNDAMDKEDDAAAQPPPPNNTGITWLRVKQVMGTIWERLKQLVKPLQIE